jgi:hypothetical protein
MPSLTAAACTPSQRARIKNIEKNHQNYSKICKGYAKAVAPGIADIEQTRTPMNKHFMKNNLKHDR